MAKPKQATAPESGELKRLREENEDLRSRLGRIATLAAGEDPDFDDEDADDDDDEDDDDLDEEDDDDEEEDDDEE